MSHRGHLHCLNHTTLSFHSHTMGPTVHTPINKMPPTHRTSSQASEESIRKRVCKACDRCRMKKSKCDGLTPCNRCKSDNQICVFGERKRTVDKVYPRGYVGVLERQQTTMVAGLQELYKRMHAAGIWEGDDLPLKDGNALVHDILTALDLVSSKPGSPDEMRFEEDPKVIEERLIAQGAGYATARRASVSSESDRSHAGQTDLARPPSNPRATPFDSKPDFGNSFGFSAPSSRPASESPHQQSFANHASMAFDNQPQSSFFQAASASNDPQLYEAPYASVYAVGPPRANSMFNNMGPADTFDQYNVQPANFNIGMAGYESLSSQQHIDQFPGIPNHAHLGQYASSDMPLDYEQYIQA